MNRFGSVGLAMMSPNVLDTVLLQTKTFTGWILTFTYECLMRTHPNSQTEDAVKLPV